MGMASRVYFSFAIDHSRHYETLASRSLSVWTSLATTSEQSSTWSLQSGCCPVRLLDLASNLVDTGLSIVESSRVCAKLDRYHAHPIVARSIVKQEDIDAMGAQVEIFLGT